LNKNISIVYARTIDYDFALQQRPHHIMNIHAERGDNISWLNSDFSNKRRENKMRTKINDNLYVYYDWDIFKKRFANPDIYFSTWSKRYEDLIDITPKYGVLYDSLDNFVENSFDESEMIKHSKTVLTTSKSLYRLRKKEHNDVVMCPNACFENLMNKKTWSMPLDLKKNVDFNKPIILLSGALARWCDLQLLETVADLYQLVFVGKLFGVSKVPDNFIYLGCKTYDELQSYYHYCDITLLPFNNNQEALYSDPIKIYESLSHGKICVSTKIEEAQKFDSKVVYVSRNREHFLRNIKKALQNKDDKIVKQICKNESEKHSWNKRVDVFEQCIYKMMHREN
jgi:hypothetical protein